MKISNPHDKLFKEIQGVKENARDFIETVFPKNLLARLNLDSLELDNNSYIDGKLKEYFADLVYNCKYAETEVKITLLFEHKSKRPKYEHLQLLTYILNIWNHQEKEDEDLSIIIPVIFYHGKTSWEYRELSDYFIGIDDNLRVFLPEFRYILTDLTKYSDTLIKKGLFHRDINNAFSLLYKHSFDEEGLLEHLYDIFLLLKNYMEDEQHQGVVISFLIYVFGVSQIPYDEIKETLTKISKVGGKLAMTTATKLREEGIKEGIKEGLHQKAIETAKKMKKEGLSINLILRITGLTKEEIEKL